MPFAPSSFLFLVVRPGVPSSVLAPSSVDALEADRMLDMGFEPEIAKILSQAREWLLRNLRLRALVRRLYTVCDICDYIEAADLFLDYFSFLFLISFGGCFVAGAVLCGP